MKSESNQYWAWEFLRRNHVYRDAFALATSVTSEQQGSLQGTADRVLALSEIDPNLPYRAFFAPFDPMCDWDDDHEMADRVLELAFYWSVGEMLELLIPEARSRSVVTLLDEYNLESYALETWVDPTLPASNVDENIFRPSIGRGFGLSKIEAPEKTHEGATNPDGFRLQTFTIPDARRVYHSKREARPKQKVDGSFGYQGKNGQHFSRGSKVIVALSPTDVVFKLALALPLGPQLELVEKCAAEHLEDLKAAGICEDVGADRKMSQLCG